MVETPNIVLERGFLKKYGINEKIFFIFFANKYLLYPPKSSSPPSPDKQTVISLFTSLDNKKVGNWLESENGSSYSSRIFGILCNISFGFIWRCVWLVPSIFAIFFAYLV